MPAYAVDPVFGIPASFGEWCDEAKTKNMTKIVTRENRVGVTKLVRTVNPTNEGSLKGGGLPTTAVGIGASLDESITGGIFVVESKERTRKGDNFDESDISWKHFPAAAEGTLA
jgi:muramoyltetrapeptide carboxypeptidase LdcA involved in peptidoglycan recycling